MAPRLSFLLYARSLAMTAQRLARERTSLRFRVMNPRDRYERGKPPDPEESWLATPTPGVDRASSATRHKDAMVAVVRPALRFIKADARRLTESKLNEPVSSRGG